MLTSIFGKTDLVDWRLDSEYVAAETRVAELARIKLAAQAARDDLWRRAMLGSGDVQRTPPPGHPCWTAKYTFDMAEQDLDAAMFTQTQASNAAQRRAQRSGEEALLAKFGEVERAVSALSDALRDWEAFCADVKDTTGVGALGITCAVSLTPSDLTTWIAGARKSLESFQR